MLNLLANRDFGERGATAVLVALVLVLLMGIAAVAIDLGFGFNERRQSQTAADMAVMAGATEVVLGGTQEQIVNQVLDFARSNVNTTYSDAEWRALWLSCTDPDRIGFDVGTGTPVDFQPLPAPSTWGAGDIDCISEVSSFLRVRVPDQVVETTFGRVLGIDSVITSAAAVARIDAGEALGSIVPFGVPAIGEAGEICLSSSPNGQAIEPCQGQTGGGFGALQSEFFGDYFGNSQVCGNPTSNPNTMAQNVALGLDHAVSVWPAAMAAIENVNYGDPFPQNQNTIDGYEGIGYDRCRLDNGSVVPQDAGHVTPPNAVWVESGFGQTSQVFDGLFVGGSNAPDVDFEGRLRDGEVLNRTLKVGNQDLPVDNKGLWDYLDNNNNFADPDGPGQVTSCNRDAYAIGNVDDPLILEQKLALMHECLSKWERAFPSGGGPLLVDVDIEESPRLVWTPQFWHERSGSQAFQPIHSFRLVFLAGVYTNCNGNDCDIVFYPDEGTTSDMCVRRNNGSCHNNQTPSLAQLTAFLIPTDAVPVEARPPIPGEDTAHTASLFR